MSRTISQNPSNALVVPTSTGFTAGDLVYYKGATNDYVPLANLSATGSGTFAYTDTTGLMSSGTGGAVRPVFGESTGNVSTATAGNNQNQFAAVLTNGNIVQAFVNGSNQVMFQIVDTTNTQVVAPTVVSATYLQSYYKCGVVALTGGGFVVFWVNTSGGTTLKPCYAIYTNTGSVTTAAVNDTSDAQTHDSQYPIRGVALANGGFALVLVETSAANPVYRAFGATGTGAYAWVKYAGSTLYSQSQGIGIAARSDNSIILFFRNSTTNLFYVLFNSSGTSITSANITVTASGGAVAASVTTLSNGTTYVLAYTNTIASTLQNCFRLLPTGNTLGSEVVLPGANYLQNQAGNYNFVSVLGLSSGGFAYAFTDYTSAILYAVFDASGNALSGTNSSGVLPKVIPSSRLQQYYEVTLLEYGGNLNFYWTSTYLNTYVPNQNWARASLSTYNLVLTASSSQLIGSTSAALSAPVVSTATPTKVSCYAANTEVVTFTGSLPTGTTAPTPTVILTAACLSIASTTLPNGKVLIAYHQTSNNTVYVACYSITMALEQTITIGTANSSNFYLKIAGLTTGGFVVGFFTAANTYTTYLYNSSYAFVTSTAIGSVTNSANIGTAIASLSNGRYVVSYANSPTAYYAIYNSTTGALVSGPTNWYTAGSASYSVTASANNSGGFALSVWDAGATSMQVNAFINLTGSTYGSISSFSTGQSNNLAANASSAWIPGSGICVLGFNGGNQGPFSYGDNATQLLSFANGNVGITNATAAIGATGNGSLAFAGFYSSTFYLSCYTGGVVWGQGSTAGAFTFGVSARQFTSSAYTFLNSGVYCQTCITPGQGYNAVIAWLNASSQPSFINVNMFTFTGNVSLTAGSTVSTSVVPVMSATTNVTPVIQNSVLVGVAGSTASAGGTGVVLTQGATQLNTNYSASTAAQSFDNQTPNGTGVPGVKGSIIGRNVNLQGAA